MHHGTWRFECYFLRWVYESKFFINGTHGTHLTREQRFGLVESHFRGDQLWHDFDRGSSSWSSRHKSCGHNLDRIVSKQQAPLLCFRCCYRFPSFWPAEPDLYWLKIYNNKIFRNTLARRWNDFHGFRRENDKCTKFRTEDANCLTQLHHEQN